jgi:predicted TIM-barrel fold metal-dependent hydrolase
LIVDAHAHIFDRVRGQIGAGTTESLSFGRIRFGREGTLRLMPPLAADTSFSAQALLEYMDWVGVDKAVLLQGPFYGDMNEYVRQAVDRWPDRFIGTVGFDPWSGGASEAFGPTLDTLGFRNVKLELSDQTGLIGLHPEARLDDEPLAWFWEESERRGLTITLDLGNIGGRGYQTRELENVLSRHPDLRLVIAHLAQPPVGAEEDSGLDRLWQEQLLLARHPEVWLDLASLPAYGENEEYPFVRAIRYVRRAVDLVGAAKLMWGSDIPGLLVHATYAQILGFVARHCDFLTEAELEMVLGGNALQVYGRSR